VPACRRRSRDTRRLRARRPPRRDRALRSGGRYVPALGIQLDDARFRALWSRSAGVSSRMTQPTPPCAPPTWTSSPRTGSTSWSSAGDQRAVSAAALAARGAKVALIDRGDFASVTSQQSSNLAWAASSTWRRTSSSGAQALPCPQRADPRVPEHGAGSGSSPRLRAGSATAGSSSGSAPPLLGDRQLLHPAPAVALRRRHRARKPAIQTRGLAGGSSTRTPTCTTTTHASSGVHPLGARPCCVAANYVEALAPRARPRLLTRARDVTTGRN